MISGDVVNVYDGYFVAHESKAMESKASEKLESRIAADALHDSGETSDPPKCHPGTRIRVLSLMLTWAMNTTYDLPMKWLNGPAGAGKSAIMRTFAQMLVERSLLLATFFFFRSVGTRNTKENLITTIAFQICRTIPSIRTYVEQAIDLNPAIFKASIPAQIQTLIVNPLLCYFYNPNSSIISPFPRIILIDGLDECRGIEVQQEIITVFSELVKTLPIPLAVIISSRPEVHIRMKFEARSLKNISSPITLDDTLNPEEDIATFYMAEFSEIRVSHPMKSYLDRAWPDDTVVAKLVQNASGQFIYAATVIKFVKSTRHNPTVRLKMVLGIIDRGNAKPFEQLDLLYTFVFLSVYSDTLPAALQVLGIILCLPNPGPTDPIVQTQSPLFLEFLLGSEPGHVRSLLLDLESLLTVTSDDSNIKIFHTSLSDFLFDKSRSGDLFIDKGVIYATIARLCITRLLSPELGQQTDSEPHPSTVTPIEGTTAWALYLYSQIHHCLVKANPTQDLHKAIVACDMAKVLKLNEQGNRSETVANIGFNALAPIFLHGVEHSRFPDAADLYEMKFKSFTTIIVPQLIDHWQKPEIKGFRVPFLTLLTMEIHQNSCDEAFISAVGIFPSVVTSKSLFPGFEQTPKSRVIIDLYRQHNCNKLLAKLVIQAMLRPDGLLSHPKGQTAWTDLTIALISHSLTQQLPGWPQLFILPLLLNRCPPDEGLVKISGRVCTSMRHQSYPSYTAAVDAYLKRSRQKVPTLKQERKEKKRFLGGLFCW